MLSSNPVASTIRASRTLQARTLAAILELAETELNLARTMPLPGRAPALLSGVAALLESVEPFLRIAADSGMPVDGLQKQWADLCSDLIAAEHRHIEAEIRADSAASTPRA